MPTPMQLWDENAPPPSGQVDRPPLDGEAYDYDSNLQDIDDFDKENPWSPKPTLIQVTTKVKVSPVCSIRFNNLCVNHFIVPDFSYGTASATVQFADQTVEAPGPFANRKQAKEEVCKLALPIMERLDEQLRSKKRKAAAAPVPRVSTTELNSENFIGLLQDHAQAKHTPLPEYTEARSFTIPIQFACKVRIADGPLTPFGSDDDLYPSKQEAKRAAAREAVLWLRDQCKMPAALLFKRQRTEDTQSPLRPDQTGLTQVMNDVDLPTSDTTPLPQRVHEAVAALGFSPPIWKTRPSMPPPGTVLQPEQSGGAFVCMAVHFSDRDVESEPALAGTVVKVDNVFGKKKARELCCRELLHVLDQIKGKRVH